MNIHSNGFKVARLFVFGLRWRDTASALVTCRYEQMQ